LTDLVRRAEAGEEVTLTRRGQPTVKLVPIVAKPDAEAVREKRRKALDKFRGIAKGRPEWEGVDAAHAADFLYDEKGLPA
jgi:prevent-host-death family protein